MTPVSEISQILYSIEKIKDGANNYNSNFYLDRQKLELWINLKILEIEELEGTIFILRRNRDFYNLYFISSDARVLELNLNILQGKYSNVVFIVDLVGMENEMTYLQNLFLHSGYHLYTSLVRMSKTTTDSSIRLDQEKYITYAQRHDSSKVFSCFNDYFDPYCEQIPLVEEINKWIENGQMVIYSDKREVVQGFIIFEKTLQTAYLRYWFVHPEYRDRKVGSALINFFFRESITTKRQIFWVIRTNTNAIKRYEHYGFKPESLVDNVFINRKIGYEEKNN
jgi:ribosomal protein S18 acetylase RimI-like enzyme